jgi:glycosyltransferase involved in cell wall biosynthesis
MKIIFLRGSVPPANEHPEKLLYNFIEECEDQWTQLFYYLTKSLGATGELLYQGGNRESNFVDFTDMWVKKIAKYDCGYEPDLIVCRGGFDYYDKFVKRFPKAKKVYYGAGKRYYPKTGFTHYDLFLADSKKQRKKIKAKGKRSKLFIKPAATLFKPYNVDKKYDICFMANASQSDIKRHILLIKSFANTEYTILNLGNTDKRLIQLAKKYNVNITWGGWHLRKHLPEKISQCKVGICCSTNYDSCPRVIPEYLACGLPVIATSNMNFWHDKYITNKTGVLVNEHDLLGGIQDALKIKAGVRRYYDNNLGMEKAVEHLKKLVENIL